MYMYMIKSDNLQCTVEPLKKGHLTNLYTRDSPF